LVTINRFNLRIIFSRGFKMTIETSSKTTKGALLAIGAAALILSGCAAAGTKTADSGASVQCVGVNSCKGTSDCKMAGNACKGHGSCKTAAHACKGQNSCKQAASSCKGQNDCKSLGRSALTGAECAEKGGHEA
jgi:hypothetical protein